MRKVLILATILSSLVVPAAQSQAALALEDFTLIYREKTAYAQVEVGLPADPGHDWGGLDVEVGWDYDGIDITYRGQTNVPNWGRICTGMDFEASVVKGDRFDPEDENGSSHFFQKRLLRARFDALYPWGEPTIGSCNGDSHVGIMHFRWVGYGPVTRTDYVDPYGIEASTYWTRQARARGQLYIDGVAVTAGNLKLGTGYLTRYVEYANCSAEPTHWGCPGAD